jgi:hypothetical protein
MPSLALDFWSDQLRGTLELYEEGLLRQVAARLFRPRSQWPAEELIERSLATLANPAVVDRRLQELEAPGRQLLACIARSRQPRWRLGSLVEVVTALGGADGLQSVFQLFEAGLLYPDLQPVPCRENRSGSRPPPATRRLRSFEQWLGQASATGFSVFTHPGVLERALRVDLELPNLATATDPEGAVHEADGLDWLLRLAALWQQMQGGSMRRTQAGDLFKRDLDRLRADPLLNAPLADGLVEVVDPALFALSLGHCEGVIQSDAGELRAGAWPAAWETGLGESIGSLWAALPRVDGWRPLEGWCGGSELGNPYASAYLLSLLLLCQLPAGAWARCNDIEKWIFSQHPFWKVEDARPSLHRSWVPSFLVGLAYSLRLVQVIRPASSMVSAQETGLVKNRRKDPASEAETGSDDGKQMDWLVRLSPFGRWVLEAAGQAPAGPAYAQTLLVQPNLEVVVYRQGLTPALIARLSELATWKSLGAACTLQLDAAATYRALESGMRFETIVQTLEQHGMRALPPTVVESLRTWADKRERITVYASATLFEFATAEEQNEALARGLPGIRLSDRLVVVPHEQEVDFRHFRLVGTRDYGLPPEKCIDLDADGITLTVDLARSDLLLETEIQRFAQRLDGAGVDGRRRYRLTLDALDGLGNNGAGHRELDEWFVQRTGQPLSAAARLLLDGKHAPPVTVQPHLVLKVASPGLADGLLQWPGTRGLIRERLGPTALVVAREDLEPLVERLRALGVQAILPSTARET